MDGKNLIIRCSSLGAIMTNSRSKSAPLSETCKSHIVERFNEIEFGISNFWTNNYVKKGIDVEDETILMSQRINEWDFVTKNEERFRNDYITGIPDVIHDDFILEVKSSWQLHTFPMMDETNKSVAYDFQCQGYMWLCDKETSFLSYGLVNTPEQIIQDELWKIARKNGYIEIPEEVEREVRGNHTFDHIPDHIRCKTFEIPRDEEKINAIKERIKLCREYYDELKFKLSVI
jgi:hypothetical protein